MRAGQIAQGAERLREELWQSHKEPLVGVLYNWDSDAIWAAVSLRGRDHFRHYPMQARVGVSRALINGNIPWEHVLPSDLDAGLGPRYKVIYLPAQMAISEKLLLKLTEYVAQGGRLVMDAPGAMYDEHGLTLPTAEGTAFEKLFGVEVADVQYSNNVPRYLEGQKMEGFILELRPTKARTLASFQTGEPAVTEHRLGKGTAVVLAYDASFACFSPGNQRMEARLRRHALGTLTSPYACNNAVVYRLAAPAADHYFLINDDAAKSVTLDTRNYRYRSVKDPVTGEELKLGAPIPPTEIFNPRRLLDSRTVSVPGPTGKIGRRSSRLSGGPNAQVPANSALRQILAQSLFFVDNDVPLFIRGCTSLLFNPRRRCFCNLVRKAEPVSRSPPIDNYRGPSNKRRFVGGQKKCSVRHVFGFANTAERVRSQHLLIDLRRPFPGRQDVTIHRRFDEAGADSVHPNQFGAEIDRHADCQGQQPTFCRGIRTEPGLAAQRVSGSDVNNTPPEAAHTGDRVF